MGQKVSLLVAASVGILITAFPRSSVAASLRGAGFVPPPLAVYGQLPSMEDPELSPSGNRIAFIKRQSGHRYILITDAATGALVAAGRIDTVKVRALRWYDDNRLLILYSATSNPPISVIGRRDEWFMLATWNIATNRMRQINMHDDNYETMDVVTGSIAVRIVNGHPRLFASGEYLTNKDFFMPALFRINLREDATTLIAEGISLGADWVVDATGHIAASFDYHVDAPQEGKWILRIRRDGALRRIAVGTAPIDPPNIVGLSYDDKDLIVEFDSPKGWIWKPLRLADANWGPPLGAAKTFYDVIQNRLTGQIIGGVQDPLDPQTVFFDPKLASQWSSIISAYPNERVELISHSDDFSKILIRVFGPRDGDSYWLINWRMAHARRLGDVYRGLSTFAEVRPIKYHAADGLLLAGFLTLPPDKPAKDLSLIVLPHGGPAATDDGGFDWWAQALATRGYAVLQVNYRGSDTTTALLRAGFGQWGRKMQTDLSDGVHYLVEKGIADPKRVCIVGASYGGYAALAGVTLQTGIYRCAVSVAGVADLSRFLRWTSGGTMTIHNEFTRYWDRFLGVTGPNDPRLKAISPIDHVASVTVPILLIHGRDDTVVPYAQSEEMARALTRMGKSVQFVSLAHEDHWLSHSATREQMLKTIVKFLEANDPSG